MNGFEHCAEIWYGIPGKVQAEQEKGSSTSPWKTAANSPTLIYGNNHENSNEI
jgi:hypothetical protein